MIGLYRMYWPFTEQLKLMARSGGRFVPWSLKMPFPKVLLADCAWSVDAAFRDYARNARAQGTVLWGAQHGGGYGMVADLQAETVERRLTDRWFGWGWAEENMPSPWLVFPRRRPQPAGRIVHVEGFRSAHDDLGLVKRLYPVNPRKRDFRRFLESVRMVVLDEYGTVILETLAADVPTVVYASQVLRPETRESIAKLEAVGIVQPDARSVRTFLKHLDVERWWSRPDVQEARRSFVNRFARSPNDWMEPWLNLARSVC